MARGRARSRRKGGGGQPRAAGLVKVKGHNRSPRGPNRGKGTVRVSPHRRKKPKKGR